MASSNDIFVAGLKELAILRQVDVERLAEAVAGGKGFYGEGDIPLPEKGGGE